MNDTMSPTTTGIQIETGQSRYAALASMIHARVVDGEWPPGSALPAEHALASQHNVALGTMRRALDLLAQRGVLERVHGRGTFVRTGLQGAPMLRFFRFGAHEGAVPTSRILLRESIPAFADVASALGLQEGDPVLHLRRLRSLDQKPCLVEEIFLLLPAFQALTTGDTGEWGDLLYPAYGQKAGVYIHRAVDQIGFECLAERDATTLGLVPGHPCAAVRRNAYDVQGRCVEFRVTRGDAFAFQYKVTIA